MNAEPGNSISGVWAKLEGHVVNGVFPLHRYLGCSDHSVVFLTESAKRSPSEVAIKLVPVMAALADSQLSRWLTATDLAHPHLVRLFEAGKCQVGGLQCVYAVMEYADQNLAQLLERRALSEDEAREMLVPTVNALSFLHDQKFVQGHLKPSNVLVVGDQLKLASDTIRPVEEACDRINFMSVYHPPEARDGSCSTAGDIWALGVTMCEALTRHQPSGLRGDGAALPPDLSPAFREVVARCLSRSPHDRPAIAELEAWGRGQPLAPAPAAIPESAAIALLESAIPPPAIAQPSALASSETAAASETVAPEAAPAEAAPSASGIESAQGPVPRPEVNRDTSAEDPSKLGALPLMIGALAVFMLTWAGLRVMRPSKVPAPPVAEAAGDSDFEAAAPAETPAVPVPAALDEPRPLPVSSTPLATSAGSGGEGSLRAVHEVTPDVPRRARQTIRGTVRVSVRVIIDQDGTVFAALTDDPGPSRYFERLAIEAAKKWTFPPVDTEAQRLVLVRFDFSREGTTARAVIPR